MYENYVANFIVSDLISCLAPLTDHIVKIMHSYNIWNINFNRDLWAFVVRALKSNFISKSKSNMTYTTGHNSLFVRRVSDLRLQFNSLSLNAIHPHPYARLLLRSSNSQVCIKFILKNCDIISVIFPVQLFYCICRSRKMPWCICFRAVWTVQWFQWFCCSAIVSVQLGLYISAKGFLA